ncbi:MAG: NAD(P)H-hydrate epimerase, partial [Lachnospiraceae bacterium]
MRKAVDGWLAKETDKYSIENGMPSLVLMERAAQAAADEVCSLMQTKQIHGRIAAVCSVGNNGADGLAIMRILSEKGYSCTAIVVGDTAHATEEFTHQLRLAGL